MKEINCLELLNSVRYCVQCSAPVEQVAEEPLCEECFNRIVNWARLYDLFGTYEGD